jgi:hypothetical protein
MTRAILPGSPAIDTGDPFALAGIGGVPQFDQRGTPFGRVKNGDGSGGARIDIGAFEQLALASPALPGDYNLDDAVGAADFVVWRKTLGATGVPPFSGADGDGDGTVDPDDHAVWSAHFGQSVPGAGGGAIAMSTEVEPSSEPRSASERPRPAIAGASSRLVESAGSHSIAFSKPLQVRVEPLALRSSRLAAFQPVATRSDDALIAWLVTQPDVQHSPAFDEPSTWSDDDRDSLAKEFKSVDEVFALAGQTPLDAHGSM